MTDVAFAGLAEHVAMLERGETTSQELTDLFLARIERHDPVLNAFRVVFDELARAEAAQADARRRSGDRRPLLGIPLAIKDDTDIAGHVTAMGSCAVEEPAGADSEVVRRLRWPRAEASPQWPGRWRDRSPPRSLLCRSRLRVPGSRARCGCSHAAARRRTWWRYRSRTRGP